MLKLMSINMATCQFTVGSYVAVVSVLTVNNRAMSCL